MKNHSKCCIDELKKYTKLSKSTIKKYLIIQEGLDHSLFPYLDNKKQKLSLDIAYNLVKQYYNPNTQYKIFKKCMKNKKNKENKIIIYNLKTCNICCEDSLYIRYLSCCKYFICDKCLINIIISNISDISFKIIKCPYCKKIFNFKYLKKILYEQFYKNEELWIDEKYKKYINYREYYFMNLFKKYLSIYNQIVKEKNLLQIHIKSIRKLPPIIDEEIYGCCSSCTPRVIENIEYNYENIKIKSVQKRCVNDQNQLIVLNTSMFACEECKNIVYETKQCPHCGMKTIKPDGCNYVYCACNNKWCFICSSRLPDNTYGHNHHYWMGKGTSAYDNKCRVSEKTNTPAHVIEKCFCRYCIKRNKKPSCIKLDCKKTAIDWKTQYCFQHRIDRM